MENLVKFYKGSLLLFFLGVVAAYFLGGAEAVVIVLILCVLEISLSFDNAVVNATVLKDMNEVWRRRFLTWGILIAVFGMRIIFPVAIVSIVSGLSPWNALTVAVEQPDVYAAYMTSAHVSIMAFGGAFLMMVGLSFFFDDDKDHWLPFLEKPVSQISSIPYAAYIFAIALVLGMGFFALSGEDSSTFLTAGLSGVLVFFVIEKLTEFMENMEKKRAVEHAAKSGAAMFLYLEVLDASFSFDGVIGAFAITTDIFIIAIGLGVGAMFVRSMTIMLVEKGTLQEYIYLEHGAFYAIIALATIMFIKTVGHVPEVLTGLIGASFIGVAFVHSVIVKRKEKAAITS